jgi:membrane-anchored protein YejM (alkaline phosphatase superfamily)
MDIAVTLMQQLGASNQIADYALGKNLFDASARNAVVISDWHSIGVVTDNLKYRIPYNNKGLEYYEPTLSNDQPIPAETKDSLLSKNQQRILAAMQSISRFNR